MKFPPFEHLHFYEKLHGRGFVNISYSDMTPFTIAEFGRSIPTNLDMNWGEPAGMPALRTNLAKLHGVPRDRVLVTSGATEANFLVNAALVEPRSRVVVDAPMYSPLRDCPRWFASDVVEIPRDPRDGWALDLDRIRKAVNRNTRLLVLANLNNPTSSMLSKGELREILDIAAEHDAFVLADETFREMAFGRAPPSITTLSPRGIAVSTVSKLYGLGVLRVGWLVASRGVLQRIAGIKDYTTASASALSQVFANWAIERHQFFLDRARTIVEANRTILREELGNMPAIDLSVPDIGNVVFPRCAVNVEKLERLLIESYRTVIAHGRFFSAREFRNHFRLGLGGKTSEFRKGLANLKRALSDITSGRAPPRTSRKSPPRGRRG